MEPSPALHHNDVTDEAIRRLYTVEGLPDRLIAMRVGLHRVTVTRRRLAMGLTIRDKAHRP